MKQTFAYLAAATIILALLALAWNLIEGRPMGNLLATGDNQDALPGEVQLLKTKDLEFLKRESLDDQQDEVSAHLVSVRIRSKIGLGLDSLSIDRSDSSKLERRIVEDGLLFFEGGSLSNCTLSVPGHVPIAIGADVPPELNFMPVLGIVLYASGLRDEAAVAKILQLGVPEFNAQSDTAIAGFVGMNRFAVAIDGASFKQETLRRFRFSLISNNSILYSASVDLDARGVYLVHLEMPQNQYSKAKVAAHCDEGCDASKVYTWWPKRWHAARPISSSSEKYVWGSLHRQDDYAPVAEASATASTLIGSLVRGREYGFGVTCAVHHRYGRVFVVASQGLDVLIPTYSMAKVIGRVTPSDLESIRLRLEVKESQSEGRFQWHFEQVVPIKEGKFSFYFPDKMSTFERDQMPLARWIQFEASAPACSNEKGSLEWAREQGLIDLGSISLQRKFSFELKLSGNGLRARDITNVLYSNSDGRPVEGEVKGANRTGDVIQVAIDEKKSPGWDPTAELPSSLIVLAFAKDGSGEYDAFAYELEAGSYRSLPQREVSIQVDLNAFPKSTSTLWIGWRWRGIDALCSGLYSKMIGKQTDLTFNVPASFEGFWWSSEPFKPFEVAAERTAGGFLPSAATGPMSIP